MFTTLFFTSARKQSEKKYSLEAAKRKIQTLDTFWSPVKEQRDLDFDMTSVFYRDFFVRAVEKVMVIVRIGKIIQEYGDKKLIYQFAKTDESVLYRKFLTTWDSYWDPERIIEQINTKKRERGLWREQVII